MLAKALAALALAAAALASGCAEPPEPGQPMAATPPIGSLSGIGCWEGGGDSLGVAGAYGEVPPPGWEPPPDEDPSTSVFEQVLRCQRIGWGALERPASVLWEFHQSFTAPKPCQEEGTGMFTLGTVWFDDPELVAQALRLGMPAHLGTFSLDSTAYPGLETMTWTWSEDGGQPSTLTVADNPPSSPATRTMVDRFFWFDGDRVSYYDATFVHKVNAAGDPTAVGSLSEPMMYAKGGVSAYVGTAAFSKQASFDGTIHRFGDLECKHELPPSSWFS